MRDSQVINGLSDFKVSFREKIPVAESKMVTKAKSESKKNVLSFEDFPPGSVLAVLVTPDCSAAEAMKQLDAINMNNSQEIRQRMAKMSNIDLNWLLFRCEPEEHHTINDGVYFIPGYGALNYAGLQVRLPFGFPSIISVLCFRMRIMTYFGSLRQCAYVQIAIQQIAKSKR